MSNYVDTPFNRSVPDWRVPRPRLVLSVDEYPTSTRRMDSQWADTEMGTRGGYQPPYFQGHYVPRGPRSTWTKAQYNVYKEEQASWRENRDRHRLEGLEAMLAEELDASRPSRNRRMLQIQSTRKSEIIYGDVLEVIPGVEAPSESRQSSELSPAPVETADTMAQTKEEHIDRELDGEPSLIITTSV
jgi:hypothetical protein